MLGRLSLILLICSSGLGAQVADPLATLWEDWGRGQGQPIRAVSDAEISRVCQERARELMDSGQLSHRDLLGRGPGEQMVQSNGSAGEWGEILGAGPGLAEVFQAWTQSPAHRDVLADPRWQKWGWGRANQGSIQVFVVRFWRP